MEGHHYTDENGYGYSYDPNQMYYIDPNMQQADFYQQGQQYGTWQWQPQGYQPVQQAMYGGYPQQGMNYNYYNQYDNGFVYNQQQGLVNYDGQTAYGRQSVSSRSKHSYSQNRSKNRQRPEVRHNISSYDTENSNNNAMEANIVSHKETDSDEVSGVNLINKESSTENSNDATDFKGQDKSRNRGGRFQGTDSRTKKFDNRQQALDRQKGYDRNQRYDKGDRNNSSVNDWDAAKDESKLSEDTESGARPKSYRDSRNNFDNRRDRYSEKDRKNGQESGRNGSRSYGTDKGHSDSKNNDSNDKVSKDFGESDRNDASSPVNDTSGKSDGNGKDRKKKKEYQVYSSSNSPREWQMKPNQSNSPRNAYDRYNYRGQDYNKRHKEFNSQAIERGGDRTKLTVEVTGDGSENQDQETASKDDDDSAGDIQGSKNVRDAQRKSKNNGPQRGSRFKQKGKVDESQRGTLIEQLSKGSYECMVCCESVRASNAVWSCSNCYHVFHLRCIKKWAKSPNAVVSGTEKDGWRCPACQNLSFKFPNQYRCFCGKVRDPEVSRMDTPHSCGDVCQKDRGEGCKHPCNILCHPGPCPDCNATITKSCDCGKTKQSAKCSQSTVIKCELVCERMLNCGRHFCQAKCHSGPCDKCEKVIVQECYGEHERREVVCGSEESFTESYSCKSICSKKLDCGNHECEKPCHIHACDSCTLLPKNTSHCPCGAKKLMDLSSEPRVSCLDPVPTCGAVCNKVLDCGPAGSPHRCDRTCHEGPCGPCNGTTLLSCQCLFMDKEFKCSEIAKMTDKDHKFLCDKRCNRKKSCGRHKCGQPCCIREEHPCDLVCGRKLPCGLHKCTEPCHKNNCPPCLMAGFDELTCHCGAEVLYPPIPCGTNPPECFKPCTRQHSCDHTVRHNCHSEEKCPPCTELTKKMCMGNHVTRANIPCHLTDISCGMKCSKPLPCGEHSCIRTCHKGPCLEEDQVCQQPCQKKRDLCEHICGAMCHGDTPCPKTACKAKVILKCVCGHKESETLCSTGGISPDSDYQKLAMQSLKDSIQGIMGASSSVNISKLNQIKQGQARVLECNEECAVIERNRRIALALEIQNPDLSSKLGSPSYTDFLKEQAKKDPVFVAGIEKAFADLAESCTSPTKNNLGVFNTYLQPQEIRLPADGKMTQMQKDFDVVKSDHENRIKELESSIQKVLRNAISSQPVEYPNNQVYVESSSHHETIIESKRRPNQEGSGNILLLQLQNQFNTMRTSLSQRTADLLEARNKLNETSDLLKAAQRQSFESNSKLVGLETNAAVLERETRILKNKYKDKSERLDYANEQLNITETKLRNIENQLYDVVRSESNLKEELETVKHILRETQLKLAALQVNHTDLQAKYNKTKDTLAIRDEELIECYTAKTQTYCGFEDPDLCGFKQDNITDDFDWERIQGKTPSANTGPINDHTCKDRHGHYMYVEASGKSKGMTAKMFSPKYRGLNPQCIEFYYHMHGRTTGTFTIYSKPLTSEEFRAVWRVFGNQGNLWIKAGVSVDEETARSGYQLIFEAKTENGYEGDISLDDFKIRDGLCAADAASLEIKPPSRSDKERAALLQEQIERYRKILRRRQRMRNERRGTST